MLRSAGALGKNGLNSHLTCTSISGFGPFPRSMKKYWSETLGRVWYRPVLTGRTGTCKITHSDQQSSWPTRSSTNWTVLTPEQLLQITLWRQRVTVSPVRLGRRVRTSMNSILTKCYCAPWMTSQELLTTADTSYMRITSESSRTSICTDTLARMMPDMKLRRPGGMDKHLHLW